MVKFPAAQRDTTAVSFGMREDDSIAVTTNALQTAMRRVALVFVGFLFLTGALLLVNATAFEWIPVLAAIAVLALVLLLFGRLRHGVGVPLFLLIGALTLYLLAAAVLADEPASSASRLFSLGMLAVPLIVVGATYPPVWAGIAYAVGGFVLAEGALYFAAATAQHPFRVDLIAVGALVLVIVVRVLVYAVQRRAARVARILHDLPAALVPASERQRRAGHGLVAVLRALGPAQRLDEELRHRIHQVTDQAEAAPGPASVATPVVEPSVQRTLDELEPTRQAAIRKPLIVLMIVLGLYTVAECILHAPQAGNVVLLWIAAIAGVTCVVTLPLLTRPTRGAMRLGESGIVIALALACAIAFVLATFGQGRRLDDDPGQYLVAVVVSVLALYRPPRPILVAGLAAAVALGAVTAALAAPVSTPALAAFSAIVIMTPIVALTLASTAFAAHIIAGGMRSEPRDHWNRTETERLRHEALAFVHDIDQSDAIDEDDRTYAHVLAGLLSAQLGPAPGEPWLVWLMLGIDPAVEVRDEDNLGATLDAEQAAALSATLSAVASAPSVMPHSLSVSVRRVKRLRQVVLTAAPRNAATGWGDELASSALLLRAAGVSVRLKRSEDRVVAILSFARRH